MTDGRRLDPDLLADLDAGVLDDGLAEEVRVAAAADPRASAVLAALAATRADLAALRDPPVPAGLADRWHAALAAETGRAPARRFRPRPALLAAAVLVVTLVTGLLWARPAQPSLDRVDLASIARAALGEGDAGALADPDRRAACLREVAAPGVAPDAPLLGGRRLELDGAEAVLLLLGTGDRGRFRVVVVDPGCGPAGGRLLRSEDIGW